MISKMFSLPCFVRIMMKGGTFFFDITEDNSNLHMIALSEKLSSIARPKKPEWLHAISKNVQATLNY